MKAIETTGRIEKSGLVKLDNPVSLHDKQKVRVILLYSENEDEDISEKLWLTSISANPSFDFLKDKEEDIYSITDGKPIKK